MKNHLDIKNIYNAAISDCENLPELKIAVLCDSSTQILIKLIKGIAALQGYKANLYNVNSDKINEEIFDFGSGLYNFQPEYIFLYLCAEKLLERLDFLHNLYYLHCGLAPQSRLPAYIMGFRVKPGTRQSNLQKA